MQQGGGSQSPYAEMAPAATTTTTTTTSMAQQPVESASPISSRPPSNLDELTRLSSGGGGGDEDIEGDRAGGVASGNRWPCQETLTLLNIRSDMDAVFRDATIKGPLWEDVSRKLAEFGYKRSAKKCKEKFENVHKYYKRTKEGRAGRQDGKSYKFFSQLEALYTTATAGNVSASSSMPVTNVTTANTITLDVAPVSIGIPFSITSSVRVPTASTIAPMSSSIFPPNLGATISPTINVPGSATAQPPVLPPVPISFSSDSSSSPETEDDDDDDDDIDFDGQPSNTAGSSRKRKRQSFRSTNRMMEFFENLMKQVMQKQESMQQRFLEVIEKREQDRMIREEAWKRQEMARLAREHEIMVRERAISASRDTAIVSLLQQITGQTIQLPPDAPPPAPAPAPAPATVVAAPTIPVAISALSHLPLSIPQEQRDQQSQRRHQQQQQQHQSQHAETLRHQPASTSLPSSEIVIAIPEQQVPPQPQEIGGSGNFEPSSSRWPKVEVLALIKLRSGLELRYQEAGPKGPLWEEISSGMQRMGYKRSAKRCKEKWENINKYFKKVKESNKKRPEDAKTCPYFHELDALYRKKIIGSSSGTSSFSSQNRPEEPLPEVQHQQESIKLDPVPPPNLQESSNVPTRTPPAQVTQPSESDKQNVANVDAQASIGLANRLFREGNGESSQKKTL
ncbi:trihelix transcription factor GTL1-like isoform X3 [Mangifera indica]|uniref:trihelix transcription factor GTL1-like isoform X3 n=1 Tax=Mangifera indica TaxID=29780 RepID=UPI001CFB0DE0|nr:trihelix transcription factor GTL1-like isoform X3 [Mangifera indica]